MPERDVHRVFRTFNAASAVFVAESARHSDASG
jgi:hypothetical protein